MFKIVCFLKRRPDLSFRDFQAYYEDHHRLLGEKHSRHARRYVRRYCVALEDGFTAADLDPPYDVITEMWFDDRASYDQSMENLMQPEVLQEIMEDEARLFDTTKTRLVRVDERESASADLRKSMLIDD